MLIKGSASGYSASGNGGYSLGDIPTVAHKTAYLDTARHMTKWGRNLAPADVQRADAIANTPPRFYPREGSNHG